MQNTSHDHDRISSSSSSSSSSSRQRRYMQPFRLYALTLFSPGRTGQVTYPELVHEGVAWDLQALHGSVLLRRVHHVALLYVRPLLADHLRTCQSS